MDFFTHVTALSALGVIAVQQILKLNAIPTGFANRYPVPTLIVLSIISAILTVLFVPGAPQPQSWTDWLLLVVTIGVVAAIVYNHTLKNWTQLRAMEGDGKTVDPLKG